MKRLVRESKAESENSRAELTRLKRTLRFTKVNEIELERQAVYDENRRLVSLVGQLQAQLQSTDRHNQDVEVLQSELRFRNQELRQVAQDNGKYEELLQDLNLANRELNQKAEDLDREMQRDLGIKKRRI